MDPERWKKVEQIYNSALERKTDQRQAYLDGACAGDRELRREVDSLLGCQPETEGFWNIAADSSDYYAKQQFNPAYVSLTHTGVNPATGKLGRALGEVSSLWPNAARRVIQLAAKIYF
jgi:hypothetical protein